MLAPPFLQENSMAKLTWLGEDEQHGGGAGPSFTTAFGDIKFPKDDPVEGSILCGRAEGYQ
jgi:hypothetical protein